LSFLVVLGLQSLVVPSESFQILLLVLELLVKYGLALRFCSFLLLAVPLSFVAFVLQTGTFSHTLTLSFVVLSFEFEFACQLLLVVSLALLRFSLCLVLLALVLFVAL